MASNQSTDNTASAEGMSSGNPFSFSNGSMLATAVESFLAQWTSYSITMISSALVTELLPATRLPSTASKPPTPFFLDHDADGIRTG
ncbi:MAG: hypothetical protein LBF61_12090 [Azoarcus sp.]|jgi:hypothetical protein|nr:hypothetical protein [Azoarcus sp.]